MASGGEEGDFQALASELANQGGDFTGGFLAVPSSTAESEIKQERKLSNTGFKTRSKKGLRSPSLKVYKKSASKLSKKLSPTKQALTALSQANQGLITAIPCRRGCGLSFSDLSFHDSHVASVHSLSSIPGSNTTVTSSVSTVVHTGLESNLVIQSKDFRRVNLSRSSSSSSSEPDVVEYLCPTCPRKFQSEVRCLKHYSKKHESRRQVVQVQLPSSFPERSWDDSSSCDGPTRTCPICVQPVPSLELSDHVLNHASNGRLGSVVPSQCLPASASASASRGHHLTAPGGPAQVSSFGWHPASAYPPEVERFKTPKLKSGKDRSSNPDTRYLYLWPQECLDSQLTGKVFDKYEDLTESALAAGLFETVMRSADYQFVPVSIKMQLAHYSSLFHAITASKNLRGVLTFHSAVLERLERGQLSWSEPCMPLLESMRLNFLASLRTQSQFSTSSVSGSATAKGTIKSAKAARWDQVDAGFVCADFNNGKCEDAKCKAKHICKYCFAQRDKHMKHKPSACPDDPRKEKTTSD